MLVREGGEQPGADPANTSLPMSSNDLSPAGDRAGHEPAPAYDGRPRAHPALAPDVVASAVSQPNGLHGIDLLRQEWSGLINWQNLPYGDRCHWWNVHARSCEVIPHRRHPFGGGGPSVCGDCWSPVQGWIESGLTTTEGLLEDTFRYQPPPGLAPGLGMSP